MKRTQLQKAEAFRALHEGEPFLIPNPWAGWAVLAGIAIRVGVSKWKGDGASGSMEVLAAGFIGGDALYGFTDSVVKTATKVK